MHEAASAVVEPTRLDRKGCEEWRRVGEPAPPSNTHVGLSKHPFLLSLKTSENSPRLSFVLDHPPVTPFAVDEHMDPRLGCEPRSPQILKIDRVEVCSALPGVVEVLDERHRALRIFEAADAKARPGVDDEGVLEGSRSFVRRCLYHHFTPQPGEVFVLRPLERRFDRPVYTATTLMTTSGPCMPPFDPIARLTLIRR